MPDPFSAQADTDFTRARLREILSRIGGFLAPRPRRILSLDEVKAFLKPRSEAYRGVIPVPVALIVGSEGRYRDFARGFLPRHEHLRPRWVRVDLAHYRDIPLPPIRLYELGGAYFVRDGNHRVSVAKLRGAETIDAEVTSLGSEVAIKADMTLDELKKAVIGYEKAVFYKNTGFGRITGDQNLDFSSPGRYDEIMENILVHKYYINQASSSEISLDDAIRSWYQNVYAPIVDTIKAERLAVRFPGRTPSDLYAYMVKHWGVLKRSYGVHLPAQDAARDFSRRYGKDLWRRVRDFFSRKQRPEA
ncbi:MAG: transcriptional regulator [Spirochaetales bacterium]|nr:transcriptional regulator [Spirochaetales bacterium]